MASGRPSGMGFESGNVRNFGNQFAQGFHDVLNTDAASRARSVANAPYGGRIFADPEDGGGGSDDEEFSSSQSDSADDFVDSESPPPRRPRRPPSPVPSRARRKKSSSSGGDSRRRRRRNRRAKRDAVDITPPPIRDDDVSSDEFDDVVDDGDDVIPISRSAVPPSSSGRRGKTTAYGRHAAKSKKRGGGSARKHIQREGRSYETESWNPVDWDVDILGQAQFDVTWSGSMKDFAEGPVVDDRQRRIDPTMCNIDQRQFISHCRRNGDHEYSACDDLMYLVMQCRLRDNTVHPLVVNMKNAYNNMPFPLCVICTNCAALNTVQTTILNNAGVAEQHSVMTILPSGCRIDEQRVVDLRRLMADVGMVTYMSLDRASVDEGTETQSNNNNVLQGRVRSDSNFYAIVEDLCVNYPEHSMHRDAAIIRAAAMQNKNKWRHDKKNSRTTDVGVWYDGIPLESFKAMKEWIYRQIDNVIKIDSLCFRIVPKCGSSAWLRPKLWSVSDAVNTGSFYNVGAQLCTNKPIDSKAVDFNLNLSAGAIIDLRIL